MLLSLISRLVPAPQGSPRFAVWVYAVNFALPLGFCVLNRYWLAVSVGPASIVLAYLIFGKVRDRRGIFPRQHLGAAGAFPQGQE